MKRKLRMGMVGGGQGAFIGAVHRMAAALDGEIELVAGAFSSNPERSKASGAELGLDPVRVYGSFEEMIQSEKALPKSESIDFISIVTPNHMHFPPAKMALEEGFAVICDKPLAFTMEEAQDLQALVEKTGIPFALTHNYTGYPMVKEAQQLIKTGKIGKVRKVVVEYPQGWLATLLEASGQKQAGWRTDPKRAGISGSMGDIGTHAENLAEYITGLKIKEVCADLNILVEGRQLDDDGTVLMRFDNGAVGILYASQISVGEENNLRIRIYGELAGLEWFQAEPNTLLVKWIDKPIEIYRAGVNHAYLSPEALAAARIPAGHPEGYLEAFANIYRNFAITLRAYQDGKTPDPLYTDYPKVEDGVRGMAFLEAIVASSKSDQKWYPFEI